jgi:hypothetical protein
MSLRVTVTTNLHVIILQRFVTLLCSPRTRTCPLFQCIFPPLRQLQNKYSNRNKLRAYVSERTSLYRKVCVNETAFSVDIHQNLR